MPFAIYLFIFIELIFVTVGDIKTNKIPNLYSIISLVAFITLLMILPEFYQFQFRTFTYSLGFLFVGFIFFLMRIMGAGDVKFLFSFFLLVPQKFQESTFEKLLICTTVIGTFFLINNTIKNWNVLKTSLLTGDVKGVKSCFGTKFPYAPVILTAWIWLGLEIRSMF